MSCRIRWTPILAVVGLFLVFPTTLPAQSQATTGVIRGTVMDQLGNPIANAEVVMRETGTNFERTIRTTTAGVFIATLLPLGTYDVTVRAVGLQEARQTGLQLRVGETVDLRMRLGSAVTIEGVEVIATLPVVDPTRTEASTRLPDEAVSGLPNNGRDFLNLTLLTPNVAIVQGPDGEELTISGQRGIHNNISVDGADFNNPFFGEQRGGQRPPFTFNLDAVQEIVVTAQGANAEFGRSGGGFVNVITKSGTNEFHGSVHYFGKFDGLSGTPRHECISLGGICSSLGQVITRNPDFFQHQFGFTLGGPIVRDKAFFFVAYDQQASEDTRQQSTSRITSAPLRAWIDTAFGGVLSGDDGPITRTDNARALLAKFDFRLSDRHNLSLKYNYTWSQQENGTFDVDTWLRSANGLEKDFSHAVNGGLSSVLSDRVTNEFRFQWSREDRPRPYQGPRFAGVTAPPGIPGDRPFPDTAMDFANGFRFGMPFFLPVEYYDTRIQINNNLSIAAGNHLFKLGGEWNRVESVQTFIGFANGRFVFSSVNGFLNYTRFGNQYVECSGGGSSTTATCPAGETIVGPVLLYLQQAGVPPVTVEDAGTQGIPQHELAFFLQDTWKPHPNLTLNLGVRWEASIQPDVITPPSQVFFAPFIGQTVGGREFPSDGTIPSDWDNFQPRLGFSWDIRGDASSVLRGSAGLYYARIPGLNLASTRSTNGSRGQTLFRNSELTGVLGPPPNYNQLLPPPSGGPFQPDVYVFDKNFENPRTISATVGYEQELTEGLAAALVYSHARTDGLTRFFNSNDPALGSPWRTGLAPAGANGINTLWTVKSDAKSRYNGVTASLQYKHLDDPDLLRFQLNYTLSSDKSDDDNERDPFTIRYARADNLAPEFNWSDRDQRHRFNGWLLVRTPGDFFINNRVSAYSAQPASESCGPRAGNPFAPPAGQRAAAPADRVCADGSILTRNTLRKDNAFFSWDVRVSKMFRVGPTQGVELIAEIFNVTNSDNFLDPSFGSLLFNFDGTVQSGLGAPRQVQVGARYVF